MSEHLSQTTLSALADAELSAEQLASTQEHLSECPACTSRALYQSMLKTATAKAGQRYTLPPQLQQRLTKLSSHQSSHQLSESAVAPARPAQRPARVASYAGWAAAAMLFLIFGSVLMVQRGAQRSSLFTEVSDQHVATLAGNLPPQVLSSDRHTVKPWFQGKLPFSFNLPENLPADTKLDGANLTYLHNQAAAQLLYHIGNHRISVFVRERTEATPPGGLSEEHAGFHVAGFNSRDLQAVAISDVDPARLSELVHLIERVQN